MVCLKVGYETKYIDYLYRADEEQSAPKFLGYNALNEPLLVQLTNALPRFLGPGPSHTVSNFIKMRADIAVEEGKIEGGTGNSSSAISLEGYVQDTETELEEPASHATQYWTCMQIYNSLNMGSRQAALLAQLLYRRPGTSLSYPSHGGGVPQLR
ncbi:hypothetical protein EJ02DRAFT_464544 [Clathrospora elynae]|uniref:Uncharacterized protein n=1 Tax=Clathrospora elynae TaxID=706981 RepID=A0A6A5SUX2_9PLEO|nr:hypothetical protein EJ02DRAFT_464544 [Clathrospora elynae]